eukprot:scaffold9077_cov92-Skeletonema_marinoi.AAC.5
MRMNVLIVTCVIAFSDGTTQRPEVGEKSHPLVCIRCCPVSASVSVDDRGPPTALFDRDYV